MKYIVEKVLRTDNGIFREGDQIAVTTKEGNVIAGTLNLIGESVIFMTGEGYIERFAYSEIESIEKMEV